MIHEVHKYRRVDLGKKKHHYVFRCMLPNCDHYIHEKLIVGKKSYCWRCDGEFIIEKNKHKPICRVCWDALYGKDKVYKIVDEILGEKIL